MNHKPYDHHIKTYDHHITSGDAAIQDWGIPKKTSAIGSLAKDIPDRGSGKIKFHHQPLRYEKHLP